MKKPSGLTSEPKIIEIRNGSKVTLNSTSLKHFNEELNTLEVFAHAQDEIDKLSGQLLLDVANCLPVFLKRRYLDYLTKIGSDLNRPKFDTLRKFVACELSVSSSDYAQTFFKLEEKDKCQKGGERGSSQQVRVRQVAVNSDTGHPPGGYRQQGSNIARESGVARPEGYPHRRSQRTQPSKSPPLCFVSDDEKSRHFLADCDKFKHLTGQQQRKTVIDANRNLNCLSRGHLARNCYQISKCRQCGPNSRNKHATALQEACAADAPNLGGR